MMRQAMRKSMRWIEDLLGTFESDSDVGPARGPEPAGQQRRTALTWKAAVTALGLLYTGLVGWMDLLSPAGLHVNYLYLIGCGLVGWWAGMGAAIVIAGAAEVFLCVHSAQASSHESPTWVLAWNLVVYLLELLTVAWLASRFGSTSRGLERTVHQRTDQLRKQVKQYQETEAELRQVLQLFKQVTENIAGVFWVTDPSKSRVEYVSPEFERVWGESCQALYRSPRIWSDRIHPDDRERVNTAMLTKQVKGAYDEEYRVVSLDGTVRWVRDRAFPVQNEMGTVYRLVGIAEDVTERKRAQHLLRAERDMAVALSSTSDLRSALDRLLDVAVQFEGIDCGAVYLLNAETGDLHLEAHRGLSGSFLNRVGHYGAGAFDTRLAKLGQSVYLRYDQIPRNLEMLWGSEGLRALAVVPVRHEGAVIGTLNLASYRQDEVVSETRVRAEWLASQAAGAIARIRAEESLHRSEAGLRSIVNNAPIALLAADARGAIIFEDGQALASIGVKPGEHLHRLAADVYADFPIIVENVQRALAGEDFCSTIEFGATVLDCHYTPARGKDNEPAGFIAVATDVTERARLQRQILEISDREQARIGQDVHDGLCQQLIGLAFKANSLEQALSLEERSEAEVARRICGLLDEAITESRRVCRGLYPVRLRTEGLVPALEELAQTTSERYGVRCRCEPDTAPVRCDVTMATHLYRIAQEALNNAVKHSGGKDFLIRLSVAEGEIVLSVSDDGRGVREAGDHGGGGLGLHIMDYRARSIGGSLRVNSGRNGTTVTCRAAMRRREPADRATVSTAES